MPNTDPLLGPLQDNGGPTWTHALLWGSPAIDAGDDNQCPATDQRGAPRPIDGDGDGEAVCDIGAYEFQQGIYLYPPVQSGSGIPGANVDYIIQLYNWTSLTDTYNLALGPYAWETNLSDLQAGPLVPGGSVSLTVSVTIPPDVSWYQIDTVMITATSNTSPTEYTASAQVTTQAYAPPQISVSPDVLTSIQSVNEVVTKPLTISNGNGVTLTFNLIPGFFSNSLVAYYPFNGNADDESGNGNGGTIVGATLTNDRFGNPYSAYNFDGIDDYIYRDYSATSGLYPTEAPFAISAWFNTSATSPEQQVIVSTHYANIGGDGYACGIDSFNASRIRCFFDLDNNQEIPVYSSDSVNDGQWHHVVCMWKEDMVYLYVDGELQDTAMAVGSVAYPNQAHFKIGHTDTVHSDWWYYFNGSLDDVMVFDRALMEEEIQLLYHWHGDLDVIWLSTTPVSGTLPTNSSLPIQVTFDAKGLLPDIYTTTLYISSNDPINPYIAVPVTMTVIPTVTPTAVTISGPESGWAGERQVFTALVEPISTSLPLTYTWQTSGQELVIHTGGITDTGAFIWQQPGAQVITVTATNHFGSVMDTHAITISDVPIEGFSASNDSPTLLGDLTAFTATVAAGTNVIYTWDFGDDTAGNGAVVAHTYTTTGTYIATVTASNSTSVITATTQVTIVAPSYPVYLPIVLNQQQAGNPPPGAKAGTAGFIAMFLSSGVGMGWWLRRKGAGMTAGHSK